MVSFTCSEDELQTVVCIVQRYNQNRKRLGLEKVDSVDTEMCLIACHANGCQLRLKDLLEADDFNLAHDVVGICNHMNRETGKLEGMFSPRFSV